MLQGTKLVATKTRIKKTQQKKAQKLKKFAILMNLFALVNATLSQNGMQNIDIDAIRDLFLALECNGLGCVATVRVYPVQDVDGRESLGLGGVKIGGELVDK
jgi:hypothetical protein